MVESIKELRKICYKDSSKKRPLYMELFTMKISIYITKLFLYTTISANQITILMILLGIIGSGMIAFGSIWIMFIGITLIHLTVFLDNVDGEIARYRKQQSLMGSFLDDLSCAIIIPLMFFSLGYSVYFHTGIEIALIFGFLCSIFAIPIVVTAIKTTVVKEGINKLETKKDMLPKKYAMLKEQINVKGGGTKIGKRLYSTYDVIKEVWGFPFNVVHIHIIITIELFNHYFNFVPPYSLSLFYIIIYGSVSVVKQLLSFIVHYKGKTVFHYYNALFGKR